MIIRLFSNLPGRPGHYKWSVDAEIVVTRGVDGTFCAEIPQDELPCRVVADTKARAINQCRARVMRAIASQIEDGADALSEEIEHSYA